MRFLLVLNTPGFLRYYDETIDGLLERGHEVLLGFTDPTLRAEALEALEQRPRRPWLLGGMPARYDGYAALVVRVRTLVDFVRYLDPRFARAQWLRDRRRVKVMESPLPERAVRGRDSLPGPVVRALVSVLLAAERAIPSAPDVERLLRELRVDALLVSPLVTGGSPQTDYVKSARALGIPSGVLVASWDNLTNKGLMRVIPDRVFLWNDAQRQEAEKLHGVPPERIVATGAQPFDRWFGRAPTASREEFCARVGLDPKHPFVTFVGSTSNIADGGAEDRFVRRWIEALRTSGAPGLAELGIVVRPHPDRRGPWSTVDMTGWENAVVWPPERPNSVVPAARGEYFDSLHHSAAIVGINTSAMVEGAVMDRPVLTVRLPEFEQSQDGTLHFDHLLPENGGPLVVASSLAQHAAQVAASIAEPARASQRNRAFVERFIRPNGFEHRATPQLIDAIMALPSVPVERPPRHAGLCPLVAWAAAAERRRQRHQGATSAERERLRARTLRWEAALLRAAERVHSVPPAAAALRRATVVPRTYWHYRDAALKKRAAAEKQERAEHRATRQYALKRRPRT
jgi:hypothetical protein